jgi:hypothetical protein
VELFVKVILTCRVGGASHENGGRIGAACAGAEWTSGQQEPFPTLRRKFCLGYALRTCWRGSDLSYLLLVFALFVDQRNGMQQHEISEFERQLGQVDPHAVWRAINGIHLHPLRGPERSSEAITGDAELSEQGVTIRQTLDGRYAFRVTVDAPNGLNRRPDGSYRDAFFDEYIMSPASLEGFFAAMRARLRDAGWRL